VNFPNFPGSTDVVTVQLNDFEQSVPAANPPATCVPRRRLAVALRQPRHGRIVRVQAYIGGRLVKRVRGHRIKRLTLTHPRKADFRLLIVEWTADGRRLQFVRHFHRCGKTSAV
jgi:hypothetical protein